MSSPFNDNQKNLNNMKRNLTLDFNQKKTKLNIPAANAVLSSPDLNMLAVDTPELDKILANGMGTSTPTPSVLFPKMVTEEQENFATGFVTALENLRNGETVNTNNPPGKLICTSIILK
jgi:transcription factor AP-1